MVLTAHATRIGVQLLSELKVLFPSGSAAMWGVTPGNGGANIAKFDRAGVGDSVLFSADGKFFAAGTIAAKFRNEELAADLWGYDDKDQTWELMYALDDVRDINIPYEDFNAAVGYKSNWVPQGFSVLYQAKSDAAFAEFDLYSDQHPAEVSQEEFQQAVQTFDGEVDAKAQGQRRKEQAFIRRTLFPSPASACDICGEMFPREFLVAAHIKKRSACTYEEKIDVPAVVMAACKFGCDELFERGYVTVDSGWTIVASGRLTPGNAASARAQQLHGRTFGSPSAGRETHFAWHRANTFRS